jgi:hypothetical protein
MDIVFDSAGNRKVKCLIEIGLANVVKNFSVDFLIKNEASLKFNLCGNKKMRFSDFLLIPPSKVAGLVKINEELNIDFELYFRMV